VRCVRLPCKFHTSLYVLTQFPPIRTVMGSDVWKTPCELFMLAGIAQNPKSRDCISRVVALTKGVVDLTIPYFYCISMRGVNLSKRRLDMSEYSRLCVISAHVNVVLFLLQNSLCTGVINSRPCMHVICNPNKECTPSHQKNYDLSNIQATPTSLHT
jgi:hypothetical protein